MIKIGVVGVGGMGQGHCNALTKVMALNECQFAAVSDVRENVVNEVAKKFNVKPFVNYDDMFKQVDGVVVATPPLAHKPVVEAAAKAGVSVFCEKPLSTTVEDADAMIKAADDNKVALMVGQVLRFYPVHAHGKKLIDAGEIGDLVYIETDYTSRYSGKREKPSSWYGTIGGFLENGIHKSDLINWFGGDPVYVSAEAGSFSGYDDWEDYVATLIRYRNSVVGILRWGPFLGARGTNETIIDGTKGSMRLDMSRNMIYLKLIGEAEWREVVPENSSANGVVEELRHFVHCIKNKETPLVDGRAGKKAVEIVLASYKSAKENIKVRLG